MDITNYKMLQEYQINNPKTSAFKVNVFSFVFSFLFIAYDVSYLDIGKIGQILKWLSIVLLAVVLILSKKQGLQLPKIKGWFFWIAFNCLGVITTFYSEQTIPSLITLAGVNIYFLIYYVSSYQISRSRKNLIKFNNIVIIVGILTSLMGLLAKVSQTLYQFHSSYYGRVRVFGIFEQPNLFGAICSVCVIACIINLKLSKGYGTWYKIKMFSVIAVFLVMLNISDSRGALYSASIFTGIFLMGAVLKKIRSNTLRISVLLLLIAGVFLALFLSKDYINTSNGGDIIAEWTSGRTENWLVLFNVITADQFRFMFGYGMSSGAGGSLGDIVINTDNGYLIWLFQSGVLSLALVLILLVNLFRVNAKNKTIRHITIPVFISYVIYAFFENFLMSFGHIVPFYCWTILFLGFHIKEDFA